MNRSFAYVIVGLVPFQAIHAQNALKHFYVYNECYKSISATATYVPLDSANPTSSSISVAPGNQKMLATTYGTILSSKSVAEDKAMVWSSRDFTLTEGEYTHVIACNCPKSDAACTLPDRWPNAKSRQYPDGDPPSPGKAAKPKAPDIKPSK